MVKERSVIEDLAEAAGKKGFRGERWYREMTVGKACGLLQGGAVKRCALVVLALILKADFSRLDSEHTFFQKIRETLGAEPVTVPVSVEAHKALAMKYLVG